MARTITCTNNAGTTVTFTETGFDPFILGHADGIYTTDNNVAIDENTALDGGTWLGSTAKVRNIVLTILYPPEVKHYTENYRNLLYRLFPKGVKGTLTYAEGDEVRVIDYYVESITQGPANRRVFNVSLLCPDPYFYDPQPFVVIMGDFEGAFVFPHNFTADGEEIGFRSLVQMRNIENNNGVDGIGLTIRITAMDTVVNPVLSHGEQEVSLQIGYTGKNMTLSEGDVLLITTGNTNKHVYLIRNGVQTEVNEYLTEDSVFFQLNRGDNHISYDAASGATDMSLTVSYRLQYEGA